MSSDQGTREPRGRRPDFRLPAVLGVTARRTRFEPPRHRNFESSLPPLDSTVELLVETDGPIPARALSPVLYVGDVPVTEVSAQDETHYRFVAMAPDQLRVGAPVTLGWSGLAAERVETGYRFEGVEEFGTSGA
jgi:hypothetical protein